MALTGDFAALKKLRSNMVALAKGSAFLIGVRSEVTKLLRDEFSRGVGPDGAPWQPTVRGKPALISRKLPQAFKSNIQGNVVLFRGSVRRGWLDAQHEGRKFAARKVAANKQYLSFNKRGKLIPQSKIFTSKKPRGFFQKVKAQFVKPPQQARKGVYQIFAKAHSIRGRILPARPIYPPNELTPRWSNAIANGIQRGVMIWFSRATK